MTPISIKSLVVSEARHGRVEGENNFNSMKIKINDFTSKEVIFFHVFCLSLNNHEPALRLKQSQNQIQKKKEILIDVKAIILIIMEFHYLGPFLPHNVL